MAQQTCIEKMNCINESILAQYSNNEMNIGLLAGMLEVI